MTTQSTSAGTLAHDSHGSGDALVLLPGAGQQQQDHELAIRRPGLANGLMIIDGGGRTNRPNNGAPTAKEQQQ